MSIQTVNQKELDNFQDNKEYINDSIILDEAIISSLNSNMRDFCLQIEEYLTEFVNEQKESATIKDLNRHERKIVHKLAERFNINRDFVEKKDNDMGDITISNTLQSNVPKFSILESLKKLQEMQNQSNPFTKLPNNPYGDASNMTQMPPQMQNLQNHMMKPPGFPPAMFPQNQYGFQGQNQLLFQQQYQQNMFMSQQMPQMGQMMQMGFNPYMQGHPFMGGFGFQQQFPPNQNKNNFKRNQNKSQQKSAEKKNTVMKMDDMLNEDMFPSLGDNQKTQSQTKESQQTYNIQQQGKAEIKTKDECQNDL